MSKNIIGTVKLVGDNIDTDQIIPARYCRTIDPDQLGPDCMRDTHLFPLLPETIIFAGYNFGCGSSREHAVYALIGAGVKAVVAFSFARIFYRNCVNVGFPALLIKEQKLEFFSEKKITIDLSNCRMKALNSKHTISLIVQDQRLVNVMLSGGVFNSNQFVFDRKVK